MPLPRVPVWKKPEPVQKRLTPVGPALLFRFSCRCPPKALYYDRMRCMAANAFLEESGPGMWPAMANNRGSGCIGNQGISSELAAHD